MTLEMFVLAEYISCAPDAKLTICNTFRNWNTTSLPTVVRGYVASVVRFSDDEEGEHVMEISMRNADGKEIARVTTTFTVVFDMRQSYAAQFNQALATLIEEKGQYELTLYMDSVEISSLLLYIDLIKADEPTAPV